MAVALYTIDVGHGLCQVIMFPGKRAIVIDGGDLFALRTVSEFLYHNVDTILAYIATHNDRDHVASAIHFLNLEKFRSREGLRAIYLTIDRGSNSDISILDYALRRKQQETIERFGCGFLDDSEPPEPKEIYSSDSESVRLDLVYPRFEELVPAVRAKSRNSRLQNRSSACLRLEVGKVTALITGDIDRVGLTRILDTYGLDLSADILTVPHHGGHIPGSKGDRTWVEIVSEVDPSVALVSSGYRTKNSTTVLDRVTFEPLRQLRTDVYCTQLTGHCHGNYSELHPGVIARTGRFHSRKVTQMSGDPNYPQAVACMGTVVIVFDGQSFSVIRNREHQIAVHGMGHTGQDLYCRPAQPPEH
ncbi:MAG: hypothetical protein HQ581_20035 [Planctomycetes bacterium]|nr:hypothetical protein [Planctomycetota bacterium]